MFFYLKYRLAPDAGPLAVELLDAADQPCAAGNTLYVHTGHQRMVTAELPGGRLLLLGDPIHPDWKSLGATIPVRDGAPDETALYEQVRGHYYWFFLHTGGICCGNSFGAIYPVYYHIGAQYCSVSSASFALAAKTDATESDRRNLLERLLFNYPFFDSTWWKGIRLLDAHARLEMSGAQVQIKQRFRLEQHFGDGADHSPGSLLRLAESFQAETGLFLPDRPFGISFTGGFDGRTLLAAARKAGRSNFLTYSFGRPGASDVSFPEAQTRRLGIPYTPILLDEKYLEQDALRSAGEFMRLTEFNGNYGRPHYHFAAQKLAGRTGYLLTGNFGSELFRALHQPGVMMSGQLIRIFSAADQSWKDQLVRGTVSWNKTAFRDELDALIADLENYLAPMQSWEPNHKFYYFVINEIFRKYFGPELVMQSHFLNNRTPFLSLRFFRELNGTIWSGVHSRLFEKMKNKRLKGQQFYSAFIRQADPQLYRLKTNKGYSPVDVLEPLRRPLLLGRVAVQKFIRKDEPDSNSVDAFFQQNRDYLHRQIDPDGNTDLRHTGLNTLLQQPDAGLEETIKYFSIAAGWVAAQQIVAPAAGLLTNIANLK